jgi:microcin C transport system substrate-binding protein
MRWIMVGWGQRPGALLTVLGLALPAEGAAGQNGLSMYGDPKYQQGFPHFDYVNPEAPKGQGDRI